MNLATKQWKKILDLLKLEGYSLFQNKKKKTLYEISWKKSGNKYTRKRFTCENPKEAVNIARQIVGLIPIQKRGNLIRLVDAFNMALKESKRGLRGRKDWNKTVEKFINWLIEKHPEIEYWDNMSRTLLKEYLSQYDGKSDTYRRLSLQPIIQTCGYMSREFGFENFGASLRLGSKLKKQPSLVYLRDIIEFLEYLRKSNPRLEVGAALEGLAGLRPTEAVRLTWDKVNLKKGLIEITGDTKNIYSKRVIPICSLLKEILGRAYSNLNKAKIKIIDSNEPVVRRKTGMRFFEAADYCKELVFEIRKWNPKIDWTSKDLRNCLPTFAAINGLSNDIWEQYIGHSPKTVTARHYIAKITTITAGEEEELERQMGLIRNQVIEPLDKYIESIKEEKILNNFERKAL